MAVRGAQTRVTKEVTSWAGVATHPHRFPGTVRSLTPSRQGQVQGRCALVQMLRAHRLRYFAPNPFAMTYIDQ